MYYNEEPICSVGDKFYRIIKAEVKEVTINKAEKMALGHYVYKDNTGRTFFSRNFGKFIFKNKEIAKRVLELQNIRATYECEIKNITEEISTLKDEDIKYVMNYKYGI